MKINDKDLPGLYQSADNSSIKEQKKYFNGIAWYLTLLIVAALFAYFSDGEPNPILKIIATILFLATMFIMIWLRVSRPDDIWYNGRAVAESVKTRSWRWMMRADPYSDCEEVEIMRKHFVSDLKTILKQNESLIGKLGIEASIEDPITQRMLEVRKLDLLERFDLYRKERITNQALWYTKKSKYNKQRARFWFWTTVVLHAIAIVLLLINIYQSDLKLPIEVIAVAASSVLTWLQAKKHNELSSSYSLTAHEIILIKSETTIIDNEEDLSDYIINCENAFSREHTQWFARKNE
ncbi:MAG: DUF4231 domain-containing protein [Bacteroidales bacterium]|jgi:uncharacterized membrane protein YhaH (DUF805 family)|nr:DUF4231 domain-containing protein [Bacteroidales bacterium]